MAELEKLSEMERRETIDELTKLLSVVQEMGTRLAYETHGDHYELVRQLNGHLHEARKVMEIIGCQL